MINTQWSAAGSTYRTLSSIGISIQKDGSLGIDNSKFGKAMNADPAAAGAVLKGFGKAISDMLNNKLSTDGQIAARTSTLQSSVQRITDQQSRMESRMTSIEARYRAQFTSLQNALSSMSSTSSYLTSQFSPKNSNN